MKFTTSLIKLLVFMVAMIPLALIAQTDPTSLHSKSNFNILEGLSSKTTLTQQERTQAIEAMLVIANEARQNPNYRKLQGCTNATDLPSGLSKFVLDDRLVNMAQDQANYQASINTFTHENSNYVDYNARKNAFLPGISVPEACGGSDLLKEFPINWMKSESHYRPFWNLDNGVYNSIGFGMAKGNDGFWYSTAVWANIPNPIYKGSTPQSGSTVDNIAKGKATTQSSEAYNCPASKAVDGNSSGTWDFGKTITHTKEDGNNPWWEVDLGGVFDISEIKIWNRTDDCCWNRLKDFYVMVSEDPITENSTALFQFTPGAKSFDSASNPSTTLAGNKKGRFVRVFIQGDKKVLSLAEVEVKGTPAAATTPPSGTAMGNIANGKAATQSSEAYNCPASKAVDGNSSGTWDFGKTITHTKEDGSNPWWEVDLGGVFDISEIKIWNRTDECCWSRLQNFYVMVSESPITENSTSLFQFTPGAKSFGSASYPSTTLTGNKKGRFVRVFIQGDKKVLSLAEVEVKGTPAAATPPPPTTGVNVAKGKSARQSATPNDQLCGPSKAVDGNTNGTWVDDIQKNAISGTYDGTDLWWEVDLGGVYDISEIRIWNRTDACCWSFLKDFYIMVSEIPITTNSTTATQYGSGPFSFTGAGEAKKSVVKAAKGRFVRIFMQGNAQLSLAEVEVFGSLAYNPATAGKKYIPNDPNPTDEGIWFVIQNKADVDNDLEIPAKRMALKTDGTDKPVMAAIPLTGDFDEFLWRTVAINGSLKLVNKKRGMGYAMDCSQQSPSIGPIEPINGQNWMLERSSLASHGSNVYTMSNQFITSSKALQFADGALMVVAKNAGDTRQCWLFQPIDLVDGYLIPTGGAYGYDRKMSLPNGYQLVASNTVTTWGMLNAHLIYKNMLSALQNSQSTKIQNYTGEKVVIMISKDDPSEVTINTPYLYPNYTTENVKAKRGGVSGGKVLISEEVMCTPGGPADQIRREFDQVVHEMVHAIDNVCMLEAQKRPFAIQMSKDQPEEWFPWKVQSWFNSGYAFAVGSVKSSDTIRKALKEEDKAYISTVFNSNNAWMPPRWLRNR